MHGGRTMHNYEEEMNTRENDSYRGNRIYDAGMLSDMDIREFWKKGIEIEVADYQNYSFDFDKQLQHGSVDLRFRHDYKKISVPKGEVLTFEKMKNHNYTISDEVKGNNKIILEPGEMILTTTMETVRLSEDFAGIITGRSSIARLGIMVHCCQEFINPGHGQTIPLQIINVAPCSVELDLEILICQLIIFKLRTPSAEKYSTAAGSKYSKEVEIESSKIYEEMGSKRTENSSVSISEKSKKIRKKMKYIEPFLPPLIMVMAVTPLINAWILNKSFAELFDVLKNIPVVTPLVVILIALYIWLKRED